MQLDPILRTAILGCAGIASFAWLLSVVTREYSWVDRLWSILPPLYVAYFAYASGLDTRLVLMALLATLWGARLTYNFARKGGYAKHGEDYRWVELRKRMHPALFQIFNVVFIAGIQNAIIFGFTLSAWIACAHRGAPLTLLDVVAAVAFLVLIAGETIADQQQWVFYGERKARRERGEPVVEEFMTGGLFRFSRHPNFFCEQAIWWVFYLFSVASGAPWLNISLIGPVVLTALFQGSTNFTEELTLAKYPSYADYQRRTSRLWPWPPRITS
jgi:steroid 5-alpha reductase family enzyme